VEVPHAEDMSDKTFCQHMNLRHASDMGGASLELHGSMRRGTNATLNAYRKFHERLHELSVPGQYDHYHWAPTPV
jgi:hypothetical protein